MNQLWFMGVKRVMKGVKTVLCIYTPSCRFLCCPVMLSSLAWSYWSKLKHERSRTCQTFTVQRNKGRLSPTVKLRSNQESAGGSMLWMKVPEEASGFWCCSAMRRFPPGGKAPRVSPPRRQSFFRTSSGILDLSSAADHPQIIVTVKHWPVLEPISQAE